MNRVLENEFHKELVAAVAEWFRYRIVAGFVTRSSPVPLKTRRVGQRCTLNLSRAETSSRWCGVVVRREGARIRGYGTTPLSAKGDIEDASSELYNGG
ncbi:uncharacterized protein TNCV_1219781 [Trichonephila clavipes]|nr:uncharacterized protein TNCV_1219781 [Trichonephila clavipes]